MKKKLSHLFISLVALMLCTIANAQTLKLTYKIGETATTEAGEPGKLKDLLGGHDKAMTVTELTVEGVLNADDVRELRLMAGGSSDSDSPTGEGALKVLDLSSAQFAHESGTDVNLMSSCFSNCSRLETVTLNPATTEIAAKAFQGCSNLTTCNNLNSSTITKVGEWAFSKCGKLTLTEGLPTHLQNIERNAFDCCTGITSVTIPSTVSVIGLAAFANCGNIKTLNFEEKENAPELVICNEAFQNCSQLNIPNGKFPDRIVCISNLAFQNTGLTSVTLPRNEKLTGVGQGKDIGGTNVSWGAIGYGAFENCQHLTSLTIPSNITIINEVLFQNCTNLESVTIEDPTKITEIQKFAFMNNQKLTKQFESLDFANLTKIGQGAFQNNFKLTENDLANLLKHVTRIEQDTYRNCHDGIKVINIPANIEFIGSGAFADNPFVTTVTVHSGKQIDARHYDGGGNIFFGMDANKVQVVFADDAATGSNYMNYRNNITVDGVTYKNAFMDLLTKTLDENATDYTVVPQRHADIKLKRTFKAGWNTLVLPFGAQADATKDAKCARIYQKALNTSNNENDFMIAAYRGFSKKSNTFFFLKYANYDSEPLDEFEPLLIKMGAEDITSDNTYTFENVELNWDKDLGAAGTELTAEQVKAQMGKKSDGNYFDGNYNHDLNEAFKTCTYDQYYFTGTLYMRQSTAKKGTDNGFINVGDFIIQNNNFVYCTNGTKYGLKGFRGYFKQLPTSQECSTKQSINICAIDELGEATAIDMIDGTSIRNSNHIYNLNGQMVGTDASALSKGIYIINGKKFIIK